MTTPSDSDSWKVDALRLHLIGRSNGEIAKTVGKSIALVRKAITEAMDKSEAEMADLVRRERARTCAQLDLIINGHLERAEKETNSALVVASAAKEKAKLLGLNAPEKLDVTSKVTVTLEARQALWDKLERQLDAERIADPGESTDDPSPLEGGDAGTAAKDSG